MEQFIKTKYNEHKQRAKRRGIPFDLSFGYYRSEMIRDDNWKNYGSGPGKMVWSRTCDIGGYWDGWAKLVAWEENQHARNNNHKYKRSKFRKHSIVVIRWGKAGNGGYPPIIKVDNVEYEGWEAASKPIGCHPRSLKNHMLGQNKLKKM